MMNAAAGIFLAARRKAKLPYDAEVEYLEAPGNSVGDSLGAYIDLGVDSTADNFCNFDIRCRNLKSSATTNPPFGYQYAASARYGMWGASSRNIGADLSHAATGYAYDTTWHSVSLRNGEYVEYDGVRTAVGTGTTRAYIGLILFGIVTSAAGNTSLALVASQISSFTLYDASGEKLRDMIPVRFTNELGVSEGAMYDRVTEQLFRNAGTDAFLYGADNTV